MKGIILAAGRGSRMGAMTSSQPKCMTELGGKSLFSWQKDAMKECGIDNISVVCGYLGDTFEAYPIHRFTNPRWSETNMVRSLMCADSWLHSDTCLASYSDIIYEPDTVDSLLKTSGNIVVAYHTGWRALWERRFDEPLSDAETFRVDEQGILLEIGERANSLDEIQGQYMGLLKFTPAGWKQISALLENEGEEAVDRLDMTSLLRALIKQGVQIDTTPISGLWYEVDSESDYALYQNDFR
jgi:L-glutamine-phosphate cytidylyltransferase